MRYGKGSFLLDHCKQISLSVSPTYFYYMLIVLHSHLNVIKQQNYFMQWCRFFFSLSLAINILHRKTMGMLP